MMTMTDDRLSVLSALIDREPVDADRVALALEEPDARRVLVDFIRLREAVGAELNRDDQSRPMPAMTTPRRQARWWKLAAAALVPLMVGLGSGYWWREREQRRPPTPTRVIQFVPGVDWK
jgi:hypothetical protein